MRKQMDYLINDVITGIARCGFDISACIVGEPGSKLSICVIIPDRDAETKVKGDYYEFSEEDIYAHSRDRVKNREILKKPRSYKEREDIPHGRGMGDYTSLLDFYNKALDSNKMNYNIAQNRLIHAVRHYLNISYHPNCDTDTNLTIAYCESDGKADIEYKALDISDFVKVNSLIDLVDSSAEMYNGTIDLLKTKFRLLSERGGC